MTQLDQQFVHHQLYQPWTTLLAAQQPMPSHMKSGPLFQWQDWRFIILADNGGTSIVDKNALTCVVPIPAWIIPESKSNHVFMYESIH